MRTLAKIGMYVVIGTAMEAGAALWNNVLEDKVMNLVDNHKKKKGKTKIVTVKYREVKDL